jgi:hypothetical protein
MDVVLRAAVPWLIVTVLPGLAIALAIAPSLRRRPLDVIALAPAIGIGATFAVGEVLALVDAPFAPWVTAALVAVGGSVALARIRRETDPAPPDEREPPPRLLRFGAIALLAAGIVLSLGFWTVGIRHSAAVPPNRDGGHHGFYVARISDTETVNTDEIVISDPITKEQYGYYPLGFHAAAALGHRISGLDVADLVTGWVILFAALAYPIGMFVLARRLAPDRALLPGFVALATPLFGMFPYKFILWGGIAQIVGLTLVPAVILILLDATTHRGRGRGRGRDHSVAVVAGVASFGVIAVHMSQFLLAAIAAGVLLVGRLAADRGRAEIIAAVRALAVAAGVAVVLLLPTLSGALSGASARGSITEPNDFVISDAVGRLFTGSVFAPPQATLYLVALVGFAVAMYQRRYVAFAIATAIACALFFVSATPSLESLRGLSAPWYHSPDRTSGNTVPFLTIFAGIGLEAAAVGISALASRPGRRDRTHAHSRNARLGVGVAALVAAAFIASTFSQARPGTANTVRRALEYNAIQQGDLDAMSALQRLDRNHAAVLNQEMDGSIWLYATEGLRPLFTQGLLNSATPSQSTLDRTWLAQHVDQYGSDPRVSRLLDRYGIGYVFVNERTYQGEAPWINLDAVRRNPRLPEVIHLGTSHVFRVLR